MFGRIALGFVSMLALATGCTSDDTEADAVAPLTETPECSTGTVLDEYGFSTVVQTCDGVVSASPSAELEEDLGDLTHLRGSEIARTLLHGVRDRLILQTGCVGLDAIPSQIDLAHPADVAAAVERIPDDDIARMFIALFEQITVADTSCEVDISFPSIDAVSQLEELNIALGARPVEGPGLNISSDRPDNHISVGAAVAYDRLFALLSSAGPVHASDLWFSSTHLAHARGLQQLIEANDPPTTLLLGSSVVARAGGLAVIDDRLPDDRVVSLALAGATRPVHVALANEAIDAAQSVEMIVWGQSTNALFDQSCDVSDAQLINTVLDLQREAFVAGQPDVAPTVRLLGFDGHYRNTPIHDSAVALHGEWDRGEMVAFNGRDEARRDDQRPGLVARYRQPATCDVYFETISQAVEGWQASGIDVVLVATPIPDKMAELHPQGRSGHGEVIERLSDLAERLDARFIDLSDSVDDADFFDFTHVNAQGRRVFSAALGKELADR